MTEQGHRQVEHTADMALELWAPTEERLLEEAARAVVEVLTEGATIAPRDQREIRVRSLDAEDRLVQFMNEIIVLAVSRAFVASDVEVTLEPEGLSALVRGEAGAAARVRTELKSATYHDLLLQHTSTGVRARVVIDV